ncbi:hypothetical protein FEM03_17235 [Phragmitibacter flavus]|uniref:DUF4935 domain-containing protein n=1 Tax=Phragmitibacter flavus TaxID=2576071 RepID=A0A5R8KAR0_9BACT|nr:PIN domain-containing protein [Phragmitibacter flavus]TLD69391.1 hypothetical protein FEM03_17235 [Phragmitibacter flavus]
MKSAPNLRYRIYVDSSVAWNDQLTVFLSKTFLSALAKIRTTANIDVRIPRIVADEIIYQKSSLLAAEAAQLRHSKKQVNLATTCPFDDVPDDATLLQQLKKRFDSFLRQHDITIIEPSIRAIDWGRLIYDSTWRQPPFETFSGDKSKWEKGFRDRLILETIAHDVSTANDTGIAVVCSDIRLRTALKQNLPSEKPVLIFATMSELLDHLELLRHDMTDADIREALALTQSTFVGTEDEPGLLPASALEKITDLTGDRLSQLKPAEAFRVRSANQDSVIDELYPMLHGTGNPALRVWALKDWEAVGKPDFIPLTSTLEGADHDGKLLNLTWRTPLLATQAFVELGNDPRQSAQWSDVVVKALGFSVYWNVVIKAGEVQSSKLLEVMNDQIDTVVLRPDQEFLAEYAPSFASDYLLEATAAANVIATLFSTRA